MSERDLLQRLAGNAKPIAETTCYSSEPGIYGFFLLRDFLCIGRHKFVAGTLLNVGIAFWSHSGAI
jgi:hypothetical protein